MGDKFLEFVRVFSRTPRGAYAKTTDEFELTAIRVLAGGSWRYPSHVLLVALGSQRSASPPGALVWCLRLCGSRAAVCTG